MIPEPNGSSGSGITARRGRIGAALRTVVVLATVASLGACAAVTADRLGDAKPHHGVMTAHALPIHGIDVSKYQHSIDWASVASSGKRFAYIKATEGGDHRDARFQENWDGARQAGVARGAYHFMFWCRAAEDQAAWFRKVVPAEPDALPPVLDVEWNPDSRACPRRVSKEKAMAMIKVLLREMEAHTGKRPVIYTDVTFHGSVLEGELPEYAHWVRSTAADPRVRYGDRTWTMWQYTATGRVPGIRGDVDRNAFYGSEAEWARFVQTGCDPRMSCA